MKNFFSNFLDWFSNGWWLPIWPKQAYWYSIIQRCSRVGSKVCKLTGLFICISTTILISNVVSIGAFPAIKVIFTPLEYIPNIPPLSSYVINVCYKKEKKP